MTQTSDTTRAVLVRLRAMCGAATEGPWEAYSRDVSGKVDSDRSSGLGWELEGPPEPRLRGQFGRGEDASFIAESRTALPLLLDALEAAYGAVREIREYCINPQDVISLELCLSDIEAVATDVLAAIAVTLEVRE